MLNYYTMDQLVLLVMAAAVLTAPFIWLIIDTTKDIINNIKNN